MLASQNKIGVHDVPSCELCGAQGRKLYTDLADRLFGAPGYWQMKQCINPDCGMLWLDPMPLAGDIGMAYENYYTHHKFGNDRRKSLSHFVMESLRQSLAWMTNLNATKQSRQYQYLQKKPAGRLLDIGCGAGDYLNLMRTIGWVVEGVDFDAAAVKNARDQFGIKVHEGQLEDINFPDRSFDAITMNHLIEHVFYPVKLIQECRRLLKPNGSLVIITPNSKSLGHKFFSRDWRGLEPPRHLHIYSPASLKLVAIKAGFDKVEIFTTPANAEGIFRGSYSIKKSQDFDKCGMNYFLNSYERLKAALMQAIEASKIKTMPMIGEEVVMICQYTGDKAE